MYSLFTLKQLLNLIFQLFLHPTEMETAFAKAQWLQKNAEVAELVDAHDSKSCIERCVGSIPTFGTNAGHNNPTQTLDSISFQAFFVFRYLPQSNNRVTRNDKMGSLQPTKGNI